MKVTIQVEKASTPDFYSCYMVEKLPYFGLSGYGKTAKGAIEDIYVALQETKEIMEERNLEMPELEFDFRFDIGSFFNYYDYLSVAGVARRLKLNPAIMRQYASAARIPKAPRKKLIEECLHKIGKELCDIRIG